MSGKLVKFLVFLELMSNLVGWHGSTFALNSSLASNNILSEVTLKGQGSTANNARLTTPPLRQGSTANNARLTTPPLRPTTKTSTPWATYSFVYSSTYSCWTEHLLTDLTYFSKTFYHTTSSYYYTSFDSNWVYSSISTVKYNIFQNIDMFTRPVYSSNISTTSACEYINKWTVILSQCSYDSTLYSSSCSPLNTGQGYEFWKTSCSPGAQYSYSSSSDCYYCKYSPSSSSLCSTLSVSSLGTYLTVEWVVSSANVTLCKWSTWYNKEYCSYQYSSYNSLNNMKISTSVYRPPISCDYSVQFTSSCTQLLSFTSVSSNLRWLPFFYFRTSCSPSYQWYSNCYSCSDMISSDSTSNNERVSYSSTCNYFPSTTHPYLVTSYQYVDVIPFSSCWDTTFSSSSTESIIASSHYPTACQWSYYWNTRDYDCPFSWSTSFKCDDVASSCVPYVNSYLDCTFKSGRQSYNSRFTSCNLSPPWSQADCASGYGFPIVEDSPWNFYSTSCSNSWSQNSYCFDCMSSVSIYTSCSKVATLLGAFNTICNSYTTLINSCSPLLMTESSSIFSKCHSYSSIYSPNCKAWDSSSWSASSSSTSDSPCTTSIQWYSSCSACQDYSSYTYYIPQCDFIPVLTSSSVSSGWWNTFYTSSISCHSMSANYETNCSQVKNTFENEMNILENSPPKTESPLPIHLNESTTTSRKYLIPDKNAPINKEMPSSTESSTVLNIPPGAVIKDVTNYLTTFTKDVSSESKFTMSRVNKIESVSLPATTVSIRMTTSKPSYVLQTSATPKSTVTTRKAMELSTRFPPVNQSSPCQDFCENDGVCTTTGCRMNSSMCCSCSADYVGERCQLNRTFVIQSTLRSLSTYRSELMNPSSEVYKSYAAVFKELWMNVTIDVYQGIYDNVDPRNIKVSISRFRPGSIMVDITTSGAFGNVSTNVSHVSHPNENRIKEALTKLCSSGEACEAIKLDSTYTAISINPNVCDEVTMNLCSTLANCTFLGGVNYTCTCPLGYRDDSSLLRKRRGSHCTEMCTTGKCLNGGVCTEIMNSDVLCRCSWNYTGKYCEETSRSEFIQITSICVGIGVFFLLIIILSVVLKRRRNGRKWLSKDEYDLELS